MDQQVQDSIKKFENKKEFFEVKLKTRQSFREDQEALDRRLSKYRRSDVKDITKDRDKTNAAVERNGVSHKDGVAHSKLETIVMDIKKEESVERQRTLSDAVSDREDSEIRIPDNVVEIKDAADESDKQSANTVNGLVDQNGFNRADTKSASSDNGDLTNEIAVQNGDASPNKTGKSESSSVLRTNGYDRTRIDTGTRPNNAANQAPLAASTPRRLQNGHAKGSITPEPRLKLRGTRLYEKNSKLSASSSDHLDKISLKGGLHRIGHSTSGSSQTRKPVEHKTLVPMVPGDQVVSLPADGNLKGFSVGEMVTVFRLLRLPEKLIYRLAINNIDGKRFAMFSDKDLETLGLLNNPVVRYFRDRSNPKARIKKVFML